MKKVFLAVIAIATTLVSCSTVSTTIDYMESSARILEPEHNMILTPLIADLDIVGEKISYTEKEMFAGLEVSYELLQNLPELKKIALSRAAKAHNADIIVAPSIDIVTKNNRLEVTVTGFPAKYAKFRNANEQDVNMVSKLNGRKNFDVNGIISSSEKNLNVTTVNVE